MTEPLATARRPGVAAVLLLLALLFSVPFLNPFHRYPITTFDSEWTAAILLALALIAAPLARSVPLGVKASLPAVVALLIGIAFVQFKLGVLAYTFAFSSLLLFLCAVFAAYLLGRWFVAAGLRGGALRAACAALVAAGLLSFAIQIGQSLDLPLPDWLVLAMGGDVSTRRPYANVAQANHLATLQLAGMIGALYLGTRGASRRLLAIAVAVLACGLALTGSRMGILFGLGVVAIALTRNALAPADRRDRRVFVVALAAGYAVGVLLVQVLLSDTRGAMPNAIARFGEGSFGQRIALWADAVRIALAHPWLGVGVGQYGGAQYLLPDPASAQLATNNPHNIVLHVAAEFGLPAALVFTGLVAAWCWRRAPSVLRDADTGAATLLVFLLLAHSQLEYPLWYLHFAAPAALLVALAEPLSPAGKGSLRPAFVLAPVGVAMLAAAAMMKADYDDVAPIWMAYLKAVVAVKSQEPETVLSITGTMGATYFKPQMERLYVEALRPGEQRGDVPLELVRRVLTLIPDPGVIVRYIELLIQDGRAAEALPHVARLRTFAGDNYPRYRDELLDFIANDGPEADPLRRAIGQPPASAR